MFAQSTVWRYLWLWPVNHLKGSMRWTWHHRPPQIFMALSTRAHQSTTLPPAHCTAHTLWLLARMHPMLSELTSCPPSPCTLPPVTWAQRMPSMAGKTPGTAGVLCSARSEKQNQLDHYSKQAQTHFSPQLGVSHMYMRLCVCMCVCVCMLS